ncbi:MAG: hypothetical protein AB7S96_05980, partial [Candidatus Izemoplasmatales bacterium]
MNNVVELAKDYVKKILSDEFTGHDYLHSMRVYKMALQLAKDKEVANHTVVDFDLSDERDKELPSGWLSFAPIFVPIILIVINQI